MASVDASISVWQDLLVRLDEGRIFGFWLFLVGWPSALICFGLPFGLDVGAFLPKMRLNIMLPMVSPRCP
jgi:hypothetical protein